MGSLAELISFATSVEGVFSLLALIVCAVLIYARYLISGQKSAVVEAIRTKDPELVRNVQNAYGINISKVPASDALEATKYAIRHKTLNSALVLLFGLLLFFGVLLTVLVVLRQELHSESAGQEISDEDVERFLLILQGADPEVREAAGKALLPEDVRFKLEDFLSANKPFENAAVEKGMVLPPQDVQEVASRLHNLAPCTTIEIVSAILFCNGQSTFLNVSNTGNLREVEALVLHYTGELVSTDSLLKTFETGRAGYHFVIMRDGLIVQFVPLDKRAWHLGKGGHGLTNSNTIAISFDNLGVLYGSEARARAKPVKLDGESWEPYTAEQVATARLLIDALQKHLGPVPVVAHSAVDSRKADPGPLLAEEFPSLIDNLES